MSVYGNAISQRERIKLPYFPIMGESKTGLKLKLVEYEPKYENEVHAMLKNVIDEGQTYPFENMDTLESFRAYYVSHECYVCVAVDDNRVVGSFYVKPNFPGRCSHNCNTGFLVNEKDRCQGIASFMTPKFIQIARDLGYEASVFNLVFASNTASIRLWEKFGFQRIGVIPKAGKLKNLGYQDAIMYYYDLTTIPKTEGISS